jgi:hypothetical protein
MSSITTSPHAKAGSDGQATELIRAMGRLVKP